MARVAVRPVRPAAVRVSTGSARRAVPKPRLEKTVLTRVHADPPRRTRQPVGHPAVRHPAVRHPAVRDPSVGRPAGALRTADHKAQPPTRKAAHVRPAATARRPVRPALRGEGPLRFVRDDTPARDTPARDWAAEDAYVARVSGLKVPARVVRDN